MTTSLSQRVSTWTEFAAHWSGPTNFLLGDACVPFAFDLPPLDRVVAEMRADELTRITPGTRGDRLELADMAAAFRALPVAEALETSFALAHFQLDRFDVPGGFLHGFERAVMAPWRAALGAAGFTFERCTPIIFVSGRNCATNYHMDFSHVLAWQVFGRKRFCGLRDPDRWAPRDVRVNYRPGELTRPSALTESDALCHDMAPGDVLWNVLLTPHWVEAGPEVALSINLSHGGLRYRGQLSPNEAELDAHRKAV